jgi:tyrosine decarboxylase/aspartate 1-decarboxylase
LKNIDLLKNLLELWSKTPLHGRELILGSMTTLPDPMAVYAYNLFIHVNMGDPELFSPLKKLGDRTIKRIAKELLKGDDESEGMILSGGTESNYIAIYSAIRKYESGVAIAPDTVHYSVDKACLLFNCKLVKIPVRNRPLSGNIVEEYLERYKPSIIVITAGTTERGLVDHIKEISDVAADHNVWLHVDAAYGGLIVPFLYKHGYIDEDLRLYDGVTSISIDFHKAGLAPIPLGVYITRDKKDLEYAKLPAPYLLSGYNPGLLGTRPGGSVAALWVLWEKYGMKGYEELALREHKIAKYGYELLKENSELQVLKPILPIIVFKHKRFSPEKLVSLLAERKIYLYRAPTYGGVRVVVMPHVDFHDMETLSTIMRELSISS